MRNLLALIILSLIYNINLKLEEANYDFIIKVERALDCYIWNNNTIALRTNITNPIDIFDTSDYESVIFDIRLKQYDKDIIINMKCHLWKPIIDKYLALCDIEKEPRIEPFYPYEIDSIFLYKNKKIKFYAESSIGSNCANVPFIYSGKQNIDLNNEKDFYYFKFKTGAIQDTNLFVVGTMPSETYILAFDKCDIKQRDMTCAMSRKKIESFLSYYSEVFQNTLITLYFAKDYGIKYNNYAYNIEMTKKPMKKENLYIEIKRLMSPSIISLIYAAYETNVTSIDILRTRNTIFEFKRKSDNSDYTSECYFKKNEDNTPLILICSIYNEYSELSLNKIKYLSMNFIDYKYNFIITYQNEEWFKRKGRGENIWAKYPDILYFTSKNETNFTIHGVISLIFDRLTFNPKFGYLKCEISRYYQTAQCIVPKSHFLGEKSGYYYLHYNDSLGVESIFYEVAPFKVILSGSIISYNIKKVICILSLLLFL